MIPVTVRHMGIEPYQPTWEAMQAFTAARTSQTVDEIWLLQHPPVYTLGRNGDVRHLLTDSAIPVVHVDRGGQITYHGPGQLVIYLLLDLKRRKLGVRQLVTLIEQSIIDWLSGCHIKSVSERSAPGVYVDGRKIAALGIRVSRGCTTHGLSLNVDMDMTPFQHINPCGYEDLQVVQCKELGITKNVGQVGNELLERLLTRLNNGVYC